MVADDDKNTEDYTPEFSGVEHHEEYQEPSSQDEYSAMNEEEPVGGTASAQPGSSPLKKFGTAIILIVAVFAVASYLTHKKKVQLAQQTETTPVAATTPAAPQEKMASTKPVESETKNEVAKVTTPVEATKPAATETQPVAKTETKPEVKPEATAQKVTPEVVAQNKENAPAAEKKAEPTSAINKQLEESAAKMVMPKTEAPSEKVATATPPVAPTATAAVASTPTPAPASAAAETAQVSGVSDKQISDLKDQAKSNENKLNDLNTHVTNLDNAISKLNNSIAALDKKIGDMNVMPKTEKKPVAAEKILTIKPPRHHMKQRIVLKNNISKPEINAATNTQQINANKIAYVVRAVVPGRAWVESPNGYKFSISVGDRVLGYGTVTEINSDYGEVTFDGGDVIKYGPDDH